MVNKTVPAQLLSAAATGSTLNSDDYDNLSSNGGHIVVDVTALAGSGVPTLTVSVQGKDTLSGKYYTILAGAAISTVSTVVMKICPGMSAAANLVANDIIPRIWRISSATAASTGSTGNTVTATIAAHLVD